MATDTQHLRDSLIRSLQAEPLLVETEMALHSSTESDLTDEFRQAVSMSLNAAPPLAEVHREGYGSLEGELIEQFRVTMQSAVSSGANLAESEKELLSSLDLEKLGEFRSTLDAHLESDAEIAQEDLAIYVPAGLGISEEFKRSLDPQPEVAGDAAGDEKQEPSAEPVEPRTAAQPYAPGAYVDPASDPRADAAMAAASLRAGLVIDDGGQPQATVGEPVADGPVVHGLTAVPTLTAALEAIGPQAEDFGFVVRYGRYAPEGRRSEFLVGGLGLSELSKRLTSWLESHGSLDDQVQVIDEGSGELTIYLVGKETQY